MGLDRGGWGDMGLNRERKKEKKGKMGRGK